MIGLDTNVLVRYLAQDERAQAARATRLLERQLTAENPGYLSLAVLAEVVWVMTSLYKADRKAVEQVVEGLLSAPQLRVQEAEVAWLALIAYRDSSLDFSDALISMFARAAGCAQTYTFDRIAARHESFELLV